MIRKWKRFFAWFIKNGYLLYLIIRDPKTPRYLRLLMLLPVAYVFVPTDIVSDFLPILGQIDDLLVVGLAYRLLLKTVPKEVLEECLKKTSRWMGQIRWKRVKTKVLVVATCLVLGVVTLIYFMTWK